MTAKVRFEPEGRLLEAQPGENLRQLAIASGVFIRSDCNGNGTCGKCRVIVSGKRESLEELTSVEKNLIAAKDIHLGYRLSCQICVNGDLVVTIPEESGIRIRQVQSTGLERKIPLNPNVRKIHVRLSSPTLTDITPDAERLLLSVERMGSFPQLHIDHQLLPNLPNLLRRYLWDVTAVLPTSNRICTVEPRDTTSQVYGYAVDIGTSKLVGVLVDLLTGETLSNVFVDNPQLVYGEDIMSRMSYAMKAPENMTHLQLALVNAINQLLKRSCAEAGIKEDQVYEISIVGNTTMHHFLLGIETRHLALSPYLPAVKFALDMHAKDAGIHGNEHANVHVLPLIAGYVGADAVADILASGMRESEDISLLLDIGTNTELFLGNRDRIISCSCASGPAFEGAHIRKGMKAVHGAIERVRIEPVTLEVQYETVGNEKPVGICGSGILDAVAELLRCHVIDFKGRFQRIENRRLIDISGERAFVLADGNETLGSPVTITQRDIGEAQLAKAAIHAGCRVLMRRGGIKPSELKRIYIAGSFGNYINSSSATLVGMIPEVSQKIIKFIGNTAIAGAKMCLISQEAKIEAEKIGKEVGYIELGADPSFSKEFAASMYLPHEDASLFPTTCAHLGLMRRSCSAE